jgi:hypothetical protein
MCNRCWELHRRVTQDPQLAMLILAEIGMLPAPKVPKQTEARETDALAVSNASPTCEGAK